MSLCLRQLRVGPSEGASGALVLSEAALGNAPGILIVSWLGKCGKATISLWLRDRRDLRVDKHGDLFGTLVLSKNFPGRDATRIRISLELGKGGCIVRILGSEEKNERARMEEGHGRHEHRPALGLWVSQASSRLMTKEPLHLMVPL
jgi:hypothetical protein